MELIIGGAYQGKEKYARTQYPNLHWINAKNAKEEELFAAEGILGFHEFIRKELENKNDILYFTELLIKRNPNVIITSDEVGYGVVPIDPFDRLYREQTGRCCTKLASFSEKVTRVCCGVGMVIKNDKN